MAVFNQNVQAHQVMQGEVLHVRLEHPQDVVLDTALAERFAAVRREVGAAAGTGAIGSREAEEVSAALEAAHTEVATGKPRSHRLEAALSTLAGLTGGVTATTGLVEAVHSLLGALGAS